MDHSVSGPMTTRPLGDQSSNSAKPNSPTERKPGTTRVGQGRPLTARTDLSRPGPAYLPTTAVSRATRQSAGPCAAPFSAGLPHGAGVCTSLRPPAARPWALAGERIAAQLLPPALASAASASAAHVPAARLATANLTLAFVAGARTTVTSPTATSPTATSATGTSPTGTFTTGAFTTGTFTTGAFTTGTSATATSATGVRPTGARLLLPRPARQTVAALVDGAPLPAARIAGRLPGATVTYAAPERTALGLPGVEACRKIGSALRRRFTPVGRWWHGAERPGGKRMAEIAFSMTIAVLAVLLTVAVVSALLPGSAAAGGVALAFLTLTGGFSGYASWRWVRWTRDRANRLHWSVIAAFGAAATASELYGAAAITAGHSGFFERLTAFAGLGFVAALTVAVTGVACLVNYQRCLNDAQVLNHARRLAGRLA